MPREKPSVTCRRRCSGSTYWLSSSFYSSNPRPQPPSLLCSFISPARSGPSLSRSAPLLFPFLPRVIPTLGRGELGRKKLSPWRRQGAAGSINSDQSFGNHFSLSRSSRYTEWSVCSDEDRELELDRGSDGCDICMYELGVPRCLSGQLARVQTTAGRT